MQEGQEWKLQSFKLKGYGSPAWLTLQMPQVIGVQCGTCGTCGTFGTCGTCGTCGTLDDAETLSVRIAQEQC